MKVRSILALCVLLLVGSVAAGDVDQIYGTTVGIYCRKPEGPGGYFGTGAIIHPSGYVLTSTTVAPEGVIEIKVYFAGFRAADARLVKTDEKTELSILKIEGERTHPSLVVRRSATAQVGETVFTLGNAYNCIRSSGRFGVSIGTLSGIYEVKEQRSDQPVYTGEMLETTAALNPGMDGGPLLDSSGQLIGLLSLNIGGVRWLGLAVPIDVLRPQIEAAIREDMKAAGKQPPKEILPTKDTAGPPIFPKHSYVDWRFQQAMQEVQKSVVALVVKRTAEAPDLRPLKPPEGEEAKAFKDYYRRPNAPVSGFIISADGEILTSYFNVSGTLASVDAVVYDGRRLPAKVVGWNAARDVALLKAEGTGLPAAQFSKLPLSVGVDVAVIGRSPDLKRPTITRGVVSATKRLDRSAVQISAAVNYGNTGGPLVSIGGDIVGIAGQVTFASPWGQNSGIAFATNVEELEKLLPDLRAGKQIKAPEIAFLGVAWAPGAADEKGATVKEIVPGSAAEKAGVKPGDVIIRFEGRTVEDVPDLVEVIRTKKVGDKAELTVRRGKETINLVATLGTYPDR